MGQLIIGVKRINEPVCHIENIDSAALQRKINAIDTLTVDTTNEYPVDAGDDLEVTEDGVLLGHFIAEKVERSYMETGVTAMRITASPWSGYMMKHTAVPDQTYFKLATLEDALPMMADAIYQQHVLGVNVTNHRTTSFSIVNGTSYELSAPFITESFHTFPRRNWKDGTPKSGPDKKPKYTFHVYNPLKPKVTSSSSKPILKKADTDTILEALQDYCSHSDVRWRCRPDLKTTAAHLDTYVVEVGLFGDIAQTVLRSNWKQGAYTRIPYQHFIRTLQHSVDLEDVVTDAFMEGGNWIDNSYRERTLTLLTDPGAIQIPPGFQTIFMSFANGQQGMLLRRLYDRWGEPYTDRFYRRIRAQSITPITDAGYFASAEGGPADPELHSFIQSLVNVGASYLDLYGDPADIFNITINDSLDAGVFVGDRVRLAFSDPKDVFEFNGTCYLISYTTNWSGSGDTISTLGLSTRLDSLTNPLSEDWKAVIASNKALQVVAP